MITQVLLMLRTESYLLTESESIAKCSKRKYAADNQAKAQENKEYGFVI